MKTKTLLLSCAFACGFITPSFSQQVSNQFKSQVASESMSHGLMDLEHHNQKLYFHAPSNSLIVGNTVYNSQFHNWQVVIQSFSYQNGSFSTVNWKKRYVMATQPYQSYGKHMFHSITGDDTQLYITLSSKSTLTGPGHELHVMGLDPNSGGINWDYINPFVNSQELISESIVHQDPQGDIVVAYLKRALTSPNQQKLGIIKLDQNGNQIWVSQCEIPTPGIAATTTLELHHLGSEGENNRYVVTGVFDHSASIPDKGDFMIYADFNSGVFTDFNELHPFGMINEDHPASYSYPDKTLSSFHGTLMGNLVVGISSYDAGATLQEVFYGIPTGKSDMHISRIIKHNNQLKVLLNFTSTGGSKSYGIADIDETTLYISNIREYDFVPLFNEEIGVDLLFNGTHLFCLSKLNYANGIPSNGIYSELKISLIDQVNQGFYCYQPTTDLPSYYWNPNTLNITAFYTTVTTFLGPGYFTNNYLTDVDFYGVLLDCQGNGLQNYKTQESPENHIVMNTARPHVLEVKNPENIALKEVTLYNLSGQLLQVRNDVNHSNITFENISPGIYIVRLMLNNGSVLNEKVIIN